MYHRQSLRLQDYDYSNEGVYFVTVCTKGQECIFGDVVDRKMQVNDIGKIVEEEWGRTSGIRQEIDLDEFVVMPNHIHGIVVIKAIDCPENQKQRASAGRPYSTGVSVGASGARPIRIKKKSLGSFIAGFKSIVTRRTREFLNKSRFSVWHRNYYERVIRDKNELHKIREYIKNNPAEWERDSNNPINWECKHNCEKKEIP